MSYVGVDCWVARLTAVSDSVHTPGTTVFLPKGYRAGRLAHTAWPTPGIRIQPSAVEDTVDSTLGRVTVGVVVALMRPPKSHPYQPTSDRPRYSRTPQVG